MADSISKTDDVELVNRLRSGDSKAAAELYNTYVDRVYSLVFNQVDRDHTVAQEIVQETFIAALKSAGKFQGRSKVQTWLYSIANRKVADFYRRKKRQAKYLTNLPVESDKISGSYLSEPSPVDSVELSTFVNQVLSSLPLDYRQVLILKYVEGFSVLDIGAIMRRSPKSVEGLLTRARKELRAGLATSDEG